MEKMEILEKVMEKMPTHFSSNEFVKKAVKLGLANVYRTNGTIIRFLHKNAIQTTSRKMWMKRDDPKEQSRISFDDEILRAIDLLKSKGYKIMKPVSEWQEL